MQRALSVLGGAHASLSIRTASSLCPVAAPFVPGAEWRRRVPSAMPPRKQALVSKNGRARANAPTASAASGRMSDDGSIGRVL